MKNQQYKLGLVSVSFRHHTPEEILKAVKNTGLKCIEWGSDIHAPCEDVEKLEEIAFLQKKYGVTCSSYGTYFRLGETPIKELYQYIRAAKILGTDILRVWAGAKSGVEMTKEEIDNLLLNCRKATSIAKECGVTLCLECHIKTFTENILDAVWLLDSVNSPNFRMYWQPFHTKSVEQNIENAKMVSPYAKFIHVFNWKGTNKLPLKDAIKEWQNYLQFFAFPCTLLLEFMPNGKIEELQEEVKSLKNIVGESYESDIFKQ